jgi:glycerol-3-phosphate O-acyltransferase
LTESVVQNANPAKSRTKQAKWPIVSLGKDRSRLISEVSKRAQDVVQKAYARPGELDRVLAETFYQERIRIREQPWSVDPKDDWEFWAWVKKEVARGSLGKRGAAPSAHAPQVVRSIVQRYVDEIAGRFSLSTYRFSTKAVPLGFSSFLNAASSKTFRSIWTHETKLSDRILLKGQIDQLKKLSQKGTVILVPTHMSNLDSILIGWGLFAMGLPPFLYGAGLNLFTNRILGWFMNRLGAYKVDRRKKNPIYLESLKTFSTYAIEHGCHSLFFPAGGRVRSGAIEKDLKLGLLGTALQAQKNQIFAGQESKVFVVPMVMSNHFVLEAESLIHEHLSRTGREYYLLVKDEFSKLNQQLRFLWRFFSEGSEIVMRFGQAYDLFGNPVDEEGKSIDKRGCPVDIKRYFMTGGSLHEDLQRDKRYVKELGQVIAQRYRVENEVISSHVVAFAAFKCFERSYKELDFYALLRLPREDRELRRADLCEAIERILEKLQELRRQRKIHLSPICDEGAEKVYRHGIEHLGVYHSKRPLIEINDDQVASESLNLLYYYHNRLSGYGLEEVML